MKKKKMKISTKILLTIILLIFIVFMVLYILKNNPKEAKIPDIPNNSEIINQLKDVKPIIKLNKVTNNSGTTIKDEWQEVIVNYMNLYYKSLSYLKVEDIASLFTNPNGAEAHLTSKATELIVEHHKMQDNDMSLKEALYDLVYDSVSIDGNIITIELLRNDYLRFSFLDNIQSKTYDMENTFVIRKNDDKYTLDKVRIVQDYYVMYTRVLDMDSSNLIAKIDNLTEEYLSNSRKELENNRKLIETASKYKPTKTYDHAYNRDKAKEYAINYVSKRNPDFTAYDAWGGNCQNYASQAILKGGVPMDYTGEYQWKHYDSYQDYSNTPSGRTGSWTATGDFYRYVKYNTGFGMVGEVDVNIFAAEPGDIIQVGFDGYGHTVIVIDQIKDSEGKVIDLLINCNTLSLENFPLLGYVYQNKRLMKILGYND